KAERIPERLLENLAMWEMKSPSFSDFHDVIQLFSHHTYEYVMFGMDHQRGRVDTARAPATVVPRAIEDRLAAARGGLVGHDAWLAQELGEDYRAWAA
ncbi:MAG: hypothetical protein MI723_07495, partial [Caulobacterales bacterium]|nr:hypothetical protein [Caulobacterales bacterium]